MARWMWRPWAYATLIPQIAWTVRQIRRLRRPSQPMDAVAARLTGGSWEWRCKPIISAHSWMVVVIHGREVPAQPARVNHPRPDATTED